MEVMRQFAAAALVCGLLGFLAWRVRRGGFRGVLAAAGPRGRRIQNIERLPLGAQHSLHLVRLGEQALLVASFPSGCALLATLRWQDVEAGREVVR